MLYAAKLERCSCFRNIVAGSRLCWRQRTSQIGFAFQFVPRFCLVRFELLMAFIVKWQFVTNDKNIAFKTFQRSAAAILAPSPPLRTFHAPQFRNPVSNLSNAFHFVDLRDLRSGLVPNRCYRMYTEYQQAIFSTISLTTTLWFHFNYYNLSILTTTSLHLTTTTINYNLVIPTIALTTTLWFQQSH